MTDWIIYVLYLAYIQHNWDVSLENHQLTIAFTALNNSESYLCGGQAAQS